MAVTASRFGHSPVTMDWTHLPRKAEPESQSLVEAWQHLRPQLESTRPGAAGFYDAPVHDSLSQKGEAQSLAHSIIEGGQIRDCLFLGIGGSSLGPASLLSALSERCKSEVKFHFVETPDPSGWTKAIGSLDPESTLVVCVTKSGSTVETLSLFVLALKWLEKRLWKTHVVVITDPKKGDLRALAMAEQIPCLQIDPSIGGRYSIFSPVGLFPAALAGLDIEAFNLGANQVRDWIEKTSPEKNSLFILGSELIRYFPKRSVHVCMPYSQGLRSFSAWFTQMWAESLGKDGKGFSPVAALGPTDQHSIVQLLRDGPDDKVTFFLTVDRVVDEVIIPKGLFTGNYPAISLVEGTSLHQLMRIEHQATSKVLTRAARPNINFGLDQLDERAMGSLYFAFCCLTAFTGALWGVNPFDQPGVEEGKNYIHEALGRRYHDSVG